MLRRELIVGENTRRIFMMHLLWKTTAFMTRLYLLLFSCLMNSVQRLNIRLQSFTS